MSSWLFVPGNRPELLTKAQASGATTVILDLEDAIPAADKTSARTAVTTILSRASVVPIWVRINGESSPWFHDDVDSLRGLAGLTGAMAPKAESHASLESLHRSLDRPVIALVETAEGVEQCTSIARANGVERLAFGSLDYLLELRASADSDVARFARSRIANASRAAGLLGPLDGVTTNFRDEEQLVAEARAARSEGYGGKLCIHPNQVPVVNQTFAPSEEEVRWAQRVIDAIANHGVVNLDGEMIDAPVVARARLVLHSAAIDTEQGAVIAPERKGST